jgi:hypothetical protein
MKTALAMLALCVFAPSAFAKGPDCRAIDSVSDRLACYDAASPPKSEKPAVADSDGSRAAYKDPFLAEEARTTSRLKNICRGC